jgi:hypothetical protein
MNERGRGRRTVLDAGVGQHRAEALPSDLSAAEIRVRKRALDERVVIDAGVPAAVLLADINRPTVRGGDRSGVNVARLDNAVVVVDELIDVTEESGDLPW